MVQNKREVAFGLGMVFLSIFFLIIVFLIVQAQNSVQRGRLVSLPNSPADNPGVINAIADTVLPGENCLVMVEGRSDTTINLFPTPSLHTPNMVMINASRCSRGKIPRINFAGLGTIEFPSRGLPVAFLIQKRCGKWARVEIFDSVDFCIDDWNCSRECPRARCAGPGCQVGNLVNAANALSCGKNRAVLYALSYQPQENIILSCPNNSTCSVMVHVGNYCKEDKIVTTQANAVMLDDNGNHVEKLTLSGKSVRSLKLCHNHQDKRFANMRIWKIMM